MKKSTNKQMNIGLIPTTLILAGLTLVFILLVTQSQKATINKVGTPTVVTSDPAIKNTSDLDAVTRELDKVDPDAALDPDLKTVSTDASSL